MAQYIHFTDEQKQRAAEVDLEEFLRQRGEKLLPSGRDKRLDRDHKGIPRHAHKRSANSFGKSFRQNVEGSDPRYSFHHLGTDGKLYVFEAPIDMTPNCLIGARPFTFTSGIGPMHPDPAGRALRQSPLILAYHAAL